MEDEGSDVHDRKRRLHNETEQRRAKRINECIERMRVLMHQGGMHAPRDKAGILSEAVEYIATLQAQLQQAGLRLRDAGLDLPDAVLTSRGPGGSAATPTAAAALARAATAVATVRSPSADADVDYKAVFVNSSLPQVISSIDGKFLQCSDMFCKVTGYSREEVLARSIFNLTPSEYLPQIFSLVGEMMTELHTPTPGTEAIAACAASAVPDAAADAAGRKRRREADGVATEPSTPDSRVSGEAPFPGCVPGMTCASRAFNKICKMKHGLALVHVRMSLIKDPGTEEAKYMLCTILPISNTPPVVTAPGVRLEALPPPIPPQIPPSTPGGDSIGSGSGHPSARMAPPLMHIRAPQEPQSAQPMPTLLVSVPADVPPALGTLSADPSGSGDPVEGLLGPAGAAIRTGGAMSAFPSSESPIDVLALATSVNSAVAQLATEAGGSPAMGLPQWGNTPAAPASGPWSLSGYDRPATSMAPDAAGATSATTHSGSIVNGGPHAMPPANYGPMNVGPTAYGPVPAASGITGRLYPSGPHAPRMQTPGPSYLPSPYGMLPPQGDQGASATWQPMNPAQAGFSGGSHFAPGGPVMYMQSSGGPAAHMHSGVPSQYYSQQPAPSMIGMGATAPAAGPGAFHTAMHAMAAYPHGGTHGASAVSYEPATVMMNGLPQPASARPEDAQSLAEAAASLSQRS